MQKTKVAILGATGFAGEKLAQILFSHPQVKVVYLCADIPRSAPYYKLFPYFKKKTNLKCELPNIEKAAQLADLLFLALPHTVSMQYAGYLLKKKKKVIDFSADYRLKNINLYKKYYKVSHKDKKNLKNAVYGLPELFKDKIAKASLIANPGCYPTSIILAIFPLLAEDLIKKDIFIDAKSAISGAGRNTAASVRPYISNNIWAYKPFIHQHLPEILEVLKAKTKKLVNIRFVPHVVGVEAGIYSTIFLSFKKKITEAKVKAIYNKYYQKCPFVRIKKELPKLRDVAGTNFCDLGFVLAPDKQICLVTSCIDNLIKGAAGQAVQNMNIMLGCKQTIGLL